MTWAALLRARDARREERRILGRSGIFMDESYARVAGVAPRDALAHYVAKGERAGLRPNPFFDPAYFEARSGTRSLFAYLTDKELFHVSPSPCFDARWYIERNAETIATCENPLVHFWREGFARGLAPSERFDLAYFLRAVARDRWDKDRALYEHMSDYDDDLPQNLGELAVLQEAFRKGRPMTCLRRSRRGARDLLFVQAGSRWRPPEGLDDAGIDLLVNLYEEAPVPDLATHAFRQDGTKTTAVSALLRSCPSVLTDYDSVLFLDDDVALDVGDMARLFAHRRDSGLDLVQASLSAGSGCYFPCLRQPTVGPRLRSVSAVEIMMPLVSRRAIERCGWTFHESVGGWMVDVLLSREVRAQFGNTVAVAGDVVAFHEGRTDADTGPYYRYLRRHGIVATQEAGALAMRFGINDKMSAVGFHVPDAFATEGDLVRPLLAAAS